MDRLHKYGKSLKDFNYNNKEIADDIYSAINSTQFLGVSGFVAFSSQGDRIALTQIEQVINGNYVVLGYYDTQADNLSWFNREVWRGKFLLYCSISYTYTISYTLVLFNN
ncbi:hypothetical protein WA026_007521 [Henosepilachna vigintioctopunctata]|uniref:Uncharacterized protein n=1 Tax=Henosepilachna vigintioctopunctata TaxID=420089 RepID=A0AAW1UPD6_9CUCU